MKNMLSTTALYMVARAIVGVTLVVGSGHSAVAQSSGPSEEEVRAWINEKLYDLFPIDRYSYDEDTGNTDHWYRIVGITLEKGKNYLYQFDISSKTKEVLGPYNVEFDIRSVEFSIVEGIKASDGIPILMLECSEGELCIKQFFVQNGNYTNHRNGTFKIQLYDGNPGYPERISEVYINQEVARIRMVRSKRKQLGNRLVKAFMYLKELAGTKKELF